MEHFRDLIFQLMKHGTTNTSHVAFIILFSVYSVMGGIDANNISNSFLRQCFNNNSKALLILSRAHLIYITAKINDIAYSWSYDNFRIRSVHYLCVSQPHLLLKFGDSYLHGPKRF